MQDLKDKVVAACEAAVAQGWKIMGGITLIAEAKCCCPLGAVLVQASEQTAVGVSAGARFTTAADILGVTPTEVHAFATGFDGFRPRGMIAPGTEAAYEAGRELRARYVPVRP